MVRDVTLWKNHNTGEYQPILDISDFASPTGFDPSDFFSDDLSIMDNLIIQNNLAKRNDLFLGNGNSNESGGSFVNNPDLIADIALRNLELDVNLMFGRPSNPNNIPVDAVHIGNMYRMSFSARSHHWMLSDLLKNIIYNSGKSTGDQTGGHEILAY